MLHGDAVYLHCKYFQGLVRFEAYYSTGFYATPFGRLNKEQLGSGLVNIGPWNEWGCPVLFPWEGINEEYSRFPERREERLVSL